MQNLLYIIALVLVIIWALGFFFSSIGSIIHLILVLAVILILTKVIKG